TKSRVSPQRDSRPGQLSLHQSADNFTVPRRSTTEADRGEHMTKPVRKPTEPLRTRHVFLDTEVYRRAGFNISNTPFTLLAQEIERGRIVLHVSDITLAEIHRQLKETVLEKAAEAKRLARDFNRIAQISGRDNVTVNEVDGLVLADVACAGFTEALVKRFRSHSIRTPPARAALREHGTVARLRS
ncbi:PIN domain-containing protein, partial [Mesorhizobium sp. M0152]|uniref:PIN domain-containing protein n=1 Tax=Mesorhizobium sp. M0152 TaxID=2956898 RepID=UPI00333D9DA8